MKPPAIVRVSLPKKIIYVAGGTTLAVYAAACSTYLPNIFAKVTSLISEADMLTAVVPASLDIDAV